MEEKVIRHLNWLYYGVMALTLVVLGVMYYLTSKGILGEPTDPMSGPGKMLQFAAIIVALIGIPIGLYFIKWQKPKTPEAYEGAAAYRILAVGLNMPLDIMVYFILGAYRPMMWLTAMAAIAWYFTKPTLGKMEAEMKPKDPNAEDY